jgi:hypothetical protein
MQDLRLRSWSGPHRPAAAPPARRDAIVVEALGKRYPNGTEAVRGSRSAWRPARCSAGLSPIRQSPCAGELSVQSMAQAAPRTQPSQALLTHRGLAAAVEVLGDRPPNAA